MWSYEQNSGKLRDSKDSIIAVGYSGHGKGKNAPELEDVINVGPIPCGVWTIDSPRDTLAHGPFVLPLEPFLWLPSRTNFLIHGDSKYFPGMASKGCIILARDVREKIWASGDHSLQVVSGLVIVNPELFV